MAENKAGVVRRKKTKEKEETNENKKSDNEMKKELRNENTLRLNPGSYWLTRIVLLRAIGFVYSK